MTRATREALENATADFIATGDKWPFYETVERLHRLKRCTYADLAEISGISVDVIRDRVRYLRALAD